MGADWTGPGDGDPGDDDVDTTRPAGMRPAGMRSAGMRPAGMRPAGMRPAGMRPAGMRPAGMRGNGGLDAAAWSADVGELFGQMSAVVRLGARVVASDHAVDVPGLAPGGAAYGAPGAAAGLPPMTLRPRTHQLGVEIVLANATVPDVTGEPEFERALKEDLARALATAADGAFLHGPPGWPGPAGIAALVPALPAAADPFLTARSLVGALRGGVVDFASAGWVLSPQTLEAIATAPGAGGSLPDGADRYVEHDGRDGGTLLGYPFVLSRAATSLFLSGDWRQAWIAVDGDLVTVDVSTDVNFTTDETAIRAVMRHDFGLRRPAAFAHAP